MEFFFFSSRRRHTRCSRDWSSDVCSSDLTNRGSLGSQLHISWDLKGLQPIEDGGVSAPWCARLARNWFDPRDRATFHLQIHFRVSRSEEHTSELQSRLHLVCRLLLEKKKRIKQYTEYIYKY